jgi:hypothetical protein
MAVVFLITDIKPNPQGGFLIPKSPTIRSSLLNLKSTIPRKNCGIGHPTF